MVAASILPVTINNGELYFLFGKENPMEDSSKGFSDFGGRVDPGETLIETALREGSEELTGFLGNPKQLAKLIKKNGGTYKLSHNDYHIHIFFLEYDENLPYYYNQNHMFLWNRMDKNVLNETKLFEKIEIDWFSLTDLQKRRHEFRNFYKEIVDKFLVDKENIQGFIEKQGKREKQGKKEKPGKRGRNTEKNRGF